MELRDLGGALWRQKPLVALVLAVTAVAVWAGLALAPKTYVATATLEVTAQPGVEVDAEELDALRGTVAELAGSRQVAVEVRARLSVERGVEELRRATSGERVAGSGVVEVSAGDPDPRVAAEVANLVVEVLPAVDPGGGVLALTPRDAALPPRSYRSPNVLLALALGAALGLLAASWAALLRDRRTHVVRSATGAEEAAGAPLLAHVAAPDDPTVMPALEPGTAAAEVFQLVRDAVGSGLGGPPVTTLVVAGLADDDLNTWFGANTAIALADEERRVLLVDGRMGERFGRPGAGQPETPGLHDVLLGTADLASAVSAGPVPHLAVLPSGTRGSEPAGPLLGRRFAAVVDRARALADVVVVLAPPLDVSDDACVLAAGGALVLVVPEDATTPTLLRARAERVRAAGARVLGVVLVSPGRALVTA
ncbi:hypothetical protein [Nocardioides sp. SYSU D00038]|uniref:hypothetical protein n=1 Tax=Nocardioides sp. SYSU D00038 TaxID=2812554 RepID=UPI0019688D8E|nr:hypothetical protein [Nocardioides sp. SYSU D00038]